MLFILARATSTFHYGSIKITTVPLFLFSDTLSTFHYGSIKILFLKKLTKKYFHLHSTMVLLKCSSCFVSSCGIPNLHSTMVLLKFFESFLITSFVYIYIPLWFY